MKSTYDLFHATVLPAYCPAGVVFGNNSLLSNHYFSSSVHIIAQQKTHVNAQRNKLYFCIKYMMVNTNNYKISGMLIDANSASLGQFHTAVDVGCWYLVHDTTISRTTRILEFPELVYIGPRSTLVRINARLHSPLCDAASVWPHHPAQFAREDTVCPGDRLQC